MLVNEQNCEDLDVCQSSQLFNNRLSLRNISSFESHTGHCETFKNLHIRIEVVQHKWIPTKPGLSGLTRKIHQRISQRAHGN